MERESEHEKHLQLIDELELSGKFLRTEIIQHKFNQTEQAKLNLRKESLNPVFNWFRKNIIYHKQIVIESPIEIGTTKGNIVIPVININQIEQDLSKIKNPEKIGYIFITKIQILLKSTFKKGIDTPTTLIVYDRRLRNLEESLIGYISGNLAYKTLRFTVKLGYGIPLETARLDDSIGISYKFHREDLMEPGDMPFSLTYCINYALTNSHHSLDFPDKEELEVDSLFRDITHVEKIPFQQIERPLKLTRNKSQLRMIENKQKPFGIQEPKGIGKNSVLKTLDTKIDEISKTLQQKL